MSRRTDRGDIAVLKFWSDCYEAMRFACEAQAVISARLLLFASNDPSAAAEAGRMISEKITAFADAQLAAERALAEGRGIYEAAEEAYLPLRQRVRANSQRLLFAAV
jgi:hypothetical protein